MHSLSRPSDRSQHPIFSISHHASRSLRCQSRLFRRHVCFLAVSSSASKFPPPRAAFSICCLAYWEALHAGARAAADGEHVSGPWLAPARAADRGVARPALDEQRVAVPADAALHHRTRPDQHLAGDGAHVGEKTSRHVAQGALLLFLVVVGGSVARWLGWEIRSGGGGVVVPWPAAVGCCSYAVGCVVDSAGLQGSGRKKGSGLVEVGCSRIDVSILHAERHFCLGHAASHNKLDLRILNASGEIQILLNTTLFVDKYGFAHRSLACVQIT